MAEPNEFTYRKAELRRELKLRRAAVADKLALSERICELALPLIRGNVLVYVSIGAEVCTVPLIERLSERGARVYVPYTKDGVITPRRLAELAQPDFYGNLPLGAYGDACDGDDIDINVTPLLGFNKNGQRIGYGKGCYDRFFAAHRNIYKMGLAFDCQQCEFEPYPSDVPLDCCVTESKVIYF
ncbi:MAG: 5-formyltetrahydrofolate cyclo-ligase [Roseburia sp.]|nr:5-formyltetrahydrofolate cyclo-ligase [Roseburia sp.]